MIQPILKEIDLAQTTKKGGAGLEVGPTYLIMHHGRFHTGKFGMQWYGLNFCGIYPAGAQYDPPGENYSSWQRIWLIENAAEIAAEAELSFMELRRNYAIAHGLTHGDISIDESFPLEAFGYIPKNMPEEPSEDED